jgi:hypothetical protein
MKTTRLFRRLAIVPALLLPTVAGCTYMCHDYNFIEPVVDGGNWRVQGQVYRYWPGDWEPPPGSWGHWRAEDGDRYQLWLVPVAADTAFWVGGDVELENARVYAGPDTINIVWIETIDMVEAYKDRIGPTGDPQPHLIEHGKRSFRSDYFHLTKPVPDTLSVEFDLNLIDSASEAVITVWHISSSAVADRHRRWDIVDMLES